MSRLTTGYVIGLVGVVIWSTTGILIGYLLTTYALPALLLAFWRNLLACVALLPALTLVRRRLPRIERRQVRFYAVYGLLLALFNSVWTISVQANGAAVATVLGYSSAGFTAVFAWWLFGEQLRLPKIMAVTLSLIGCVMVANAYDPAMWNINPVGIVTGLGTGVLFAFYNLMGKSAAQRGLDTWNSLLYSFAFATLFTFVFNLLPGTSTALVPDLPLNGWLILILLSFGPTVLGFGLYTASMRYLSASTASLLATLEPAFTAVEAYLWLGERLSIVQIIGSLVILAGVVLVRLEKEPETPKASSPV
ncbi:MAG: DMT family transporter [Chloroflexi bacterium]|uniref:DMT family transporter n=1 Tax=Candidatus Flexifilum breve TaxID=3140694 RepID=UPI003136ACFD|nr:DMT family transporter [Chloroflexota bacterium]